MDIDRVLSNGGGVFRLVMLSRAGFRISQFPAPPLIDEVELMEEECGSGR